MTARTEVTFRSAGVECAAWHWTGEGSRFAGDAGRPCVVMAHGFSGTRDTGLAGYAGGFAAAGLDVLLFDYRGFGSSAGTPRQLVSYRGQRADYRAAVGAARRLRGVDPSRIVVWGTSLSGGHAVHVAAHDPAVAAVVALTPALDGVALMRQLVATGGVRPLVRMTASAVHDRLGALAGRPPVHVPAVGPAGSRAVMAKDGALEHLRSVAGPTWRNEVCARFALEVAYNRPVTAVASLRVPWLVQVGDLDTVAPAATAVRAAARSEPPGEVRTYPVDHFDVYGDPWLSTILSDQLDFLSRNLAVAAARAG